MPIFSFLAMASAALLALLFTADAALPKQGPVGIGIQTAIVLPGTRIAPKPTGPAPLVVDPAPAPDMNSELVRMAAPERSVIR